MRRVILFGLVAILFASTLQAAAPPATINYQGRLTNLVGAPLADAEYSVTFAIYDQATSGTVQWSAVHNVTTKNGYFNTVLGSVGGDLSGLDFSVPLYLGVKIGIESEMTPRYALNSVPYARYADHAATADSATTAGHATTAGDGIPSGAIILWTGSSCPSGYTRLSAYDGMFPRGAASYGTTSGSDTHSHTNSVSTHSGHGHTYSGSTGLVTGKEGSPFPNDADGGGGDHKHTLSGTTDSGGSHSHTVTINNGTNVPSYFEVLFCIKN